MSASEKSRSPSRALVAARPSETSVEQPDARRQLALGRRELVRERLQLCELSLHARDFLARRDKCGALFFVTVVEGLRADSQIGEL